VLNKLKEEKIPRRARSGVSPSDFSDEPLVPTPQLGAAVREDGSRPQHHEDVDSYRGGEEFASSMAADGYPEPVPAGRLFKDTNFYHETPAGHYFGGGESTPREKEQKDRRRENLSSARFDGLSGFSDNGAL
ncbi:hypothetical protein IIZ77_02815, partial [Candidatus Saccharibacteria bacterium]|nr:hypothetical protein [Candidatus Saccharibacteria bacterium]